MNSTARPLAQFADASLPSLATGFNVPAATVQAGTIVGATHNGTLYPLTIIACVPGILVFSAVRAVPATLARAA